LVAFGAVGREVPAVDLELERANDARLRGKGNGFARLAAWRSCGTRRARRASDCWPPRAASWNSARRWRPFHCSERAAAIRV
jgi:hypothetical protein